MSRIDKINHQIQRIVSQIIREQIDNPNLGMISVVSVDTTSDLRSCKIFFSVFPESNTEVAYKALLSMRSFIRKLLGVNLKIKFLPNIEFVPDDSIKYSVDIYEKIERLKSEFKESNKYNKEE